MEEPKKRAKTWLVWIALVVGFFVLFSITQSEKAKRYESFDEFVRDVHTDRVARVHVDGNRIVVTPTHGTKYFTFGVVDESLTEALSRQGVQIVQGEEKSPWSDLLVYLVVAAVVVALLVFFLRRARGGIGDIHAMRKSRARLMPEAGKATFADVGGCVEAKETLGDVVDFLRHPKRWSDAGVRLPRGVLLEGPPGCGKTLLARAVAGETNAKFYFTSASEFVEMFVGVGAARVRDTFETAVKNAPAVIFIDELDAIGRRRGSGIGWSNDEREHTLNQLLICLDGFESRQPVSVIAATNRPDILDPALLRAGRFDRRIKVPPLSVAARLETLRIHSRNKTLATDVSLETIVAQTDGWSGAQLESLVNEAALLAVRRARTANGQVELRMDDFHRAIQPMLQRSQVFTKLDSLLIESTSQLAEPTGKALVRVFLDGHSVEGEVVWADGNFLKIRRLEGEVLVPKAQIQHLEPLAGTECADAADCVPGTQT